MPDKLIIVESPTKIKSFSKILGNDYSYSASVGHIRDLPPKELGVDIENGFKPKYVLMSKKKKVISSLREMARKHKKVYLACDPDREGEAIAWHIKETLDLPEDKYFRITTNEITKEGLSKAINNPRKIDMHMVNAQQARRILDRLVGYLLSPLLWRKIKSGLSAGRVQSVATKLVVVREKKIKAFKPEEFWKIFILCSPLSGQDKDQTFTAQLMKKSDKKIKISDQQSADTVVGELKDETFRISEIAKKRTKSNPSPPFRTSTLQRKATTTLKYSASETMRIAQQLYEGIELGAKGSVGLITYMRTDSTQVAVTAITQCRQYINKRYGDPYLPSKPRMFKAPKKSQEAHEAIRPTTLLLTPESIEQYLSPQQYRLYKMIWEQFVASQTADAVYNTTSVTITAGEYTFSVQGRQMVFDGYTRITGLQKTASDKQNIPHLSEGEEIEVREIIPEQQFTKPPPRYSQATLIKTLEEEGIGRPSTYASILSTIQSRQYVLLQKGFFHATMLGTLVTEKLQEFFKEIMDITFTARLENDLDSIAEAKKDWIKVLTDFYQSFENDLQNANTNMKSTKGEAAKKTAYKCRECGRTMVVRWGSRGPFLGCEGYMDKKSRCTFTMSLNEDGTPQEDITGKIEGAEYDGSPISIKKGRYGHYLATESGIRAAIPEGTDIQEINAERAVDIISKNTEPDKDLGETDKGEKIYLQKGPFNYYLQVIGPKGKKKNYPLSKNIDPEALTFEYAKEIISLPRTLGNDPDHNSPVMLNYGRFGGFVKCGSNTHSIGSKLSLSDITLDKALELLSKSKKKAKHRKTFQRELGAHPVSGNPVLVKKGRYGYYATDGNVNASISNETDAENISLENALELLEQKKKKGED